MQFADTYLFWWLFAGCAGNRDLIFHKAGDRTQRPSCLRYTYRVGSSVSYLLYCGLMCYIIQIFCYWNSNYNALVLISS